MKNRILLIFLLSALLLIIVGCNNDCPPDEYWGKKDLSNVAKTFQPNIANKTLIFVDSANNEISLHASDIETVYEEGGLFTLCHSGGFLSYNASYALIDYERIKWTLKSDNTADFFEARFEINTTTNLIGSERNVDTTGIFYDRLWIEQRFTSGNISPQIVNDYYLSDRNNSISLYEAPRFIGDTTIMDRSFENVYEITKFEDKRYYSKEFGILVLKDKNYNPLVLDRIE